MPDHLHQYRPSLLNRLTAWWLHHLQSMIFSLGKAWRSPASTLMTVAVIGITLTLPAGFYLVLKNIQNISGNLDQSSRITLYLKLDQSRDQALALERTLQQNPQIENTIFTSREQALEQFRAQSGFGNSLDQLEQNPLPHSIEVQPNSGLDALAIKTLLAQLAAEPQVEFAQLDTEWLERLFTLVEIAQRIVIIISLLFSFAVLLIIGNTIRLDIQNRYQEIIVTKLIGATNAFIRRPFLYSGVWYGLLGGFLSWLIIEISLLALSGPMSTLKLLYQSRLQLVTFSFGDFLVILLSSTALGLAGSWLAVARHLNQIEPR